MKYRIKYNLMSHDGDMWLAEFINKEQNHWSPNKADAYLFNEDKANNILRIMKKDRPKNEWKYFKKEQV